MPLVSHRPILRFYYMFAKFIFKTLLQSVLQCALFERPVTARNSGVLRQAGECESERGVGLTRSQHATGEVQVGTLGGVYSTADTSASFILADDVL